MPCDAGNWRSGNRIPTGALRLPRSAVDRIGSDHCAYSSLQKNMTVTGKYLDDQLFLRSKPPVCGYQEACLLLARGGLRSVGRYFIVKYYSKYAKHTV